LLLLPILSILFIRHSF